MLENTRAMVLRTIKYGESGLVVDLLTERLGRVSVMVSAAVSKRRRGQSQLYQPLTQLEMVLDVRPARQLQRVREARIAEPYVSIPFVAEKLSIGLFLAEFLYYATREQPADPQLYAYAAQGLGWLDAASQSYANFHLVFMMRFSRFLGFYPNLEGFREGCFFDLRDSVFVDSRPLHNDFVEPDEAARVVTLMRMNYESMHLFRMSREQRGRCATVILDYYRLHVARFPELRSLAVLQQLF